MPTAALSILTHPYLELVPLERGRAQMKTAARTPGSTLVWCMPAERYRSQSDAVEARPGGLSLIVVLPPADRLGEDPGLLHAAQRCRPHGILPFHDPPHPRDLAEVLRRPPLDLAVEVTDYLMWRGLLMDRETTHLVRRIIELSGELRTITALARGLYISRRALGRRLMTRGLPVPSHWLQMGRILRLVSTLQNSDASVFTAACDAGYPDGFSLSNQMHRLLGYRPSQVREHLGWEWVVEAWLRREAERGGLAPATVRIVTRGPKASAPPPASFQKAKAGRPARGPHVA